MTSAMMYLLFLDHYSDSDTGDKMSGANLGRIELVILWKDCETEDCPNKVCTWGSNIRCYPCERELVGEVEMTVRYNLTHEHPWGWEGTTNYMTRTYEEVLRDKRNRVPKETNPKHPTANSNSEP